MRGIQSIPVARVEVDNVIPMAEMDPLNHLKEQRAAAWKELSKLQPELVRQVEEWDCAIAALEKTPGEYATFRSGADAAAAYLRKFGPTSIRDVCKAVTAGGWASEHPDAYWKMWDAIQYQLERSSDPKIISLGGDIIGLPSHAPAKSARRKA